MLTLQLMIMVHDYCIWLYESHGHRVCVCENDNSLCVETRKRLCRFKKIPGREFSNVSKVHYVP
jgi:hypothetical protein